MKLVAAVVTCGVFVFGIGNQSTWVESPIDVIPTFAAVTTTAPATTTVVPSTTTAVTTTSTSPTTTTSTTIVTTTTILFADALTVSMEISSRSAIETVICHPRWEWECEEALRVAWCESWHRPGSVSNPNRNGTIDRGIFQVNDVWREAFGEYLWQHILDLETNVAMAHHIWKTGNDSWLYWRCQP